MNHFNNMIAMINGRHEIFRIFSNNDGTILNTRERHNMPDIEFIIEVNGSNGVSAGYSAWYFDKEGMYLANSADG